MAAKIKFGISQKLSLMLLLVTLVPLTVIWFFSYQNITKLTTAKVVGQLTGVNQNLVTFVDSWIDMNQRMLQQNASLEAMQSMEREQQIEILETIPRYYDWAYLAFTTDTEGNNVGRSDGKSLKYYGDRVYFKQVAEGKQFGHQLLIGKTSGKPAMVLSTGIVDGTGSFVGVLAQAMTLTELSGKIVTKRIGNTGFSFLLDDQGQVVTHPDEAMTQARTDLSDHPMLVAFKDGKTTAVFENANGEKIVAVAQNTAQGLTVISRQNYDEAYYFIKAENNKAIIILVVTLIAILLSALLVSKWLTLPIRNLTEIADKYSQGQLDLKISGLDRNDEIGLLSQAIERMGTSIRLAMNRLKKK
ncbi:MAG: HAMP domain-containing protein [Desulfobulbaceae bacterium]|nr:HAMP domain-containing protein [Desulfobulbaceae bacterium]